MTFWARTLHFENRYKSIDQLLADIPAKNILELSSGFSFRGLAATQQNEIHYIDTDLPELIATKKEFIAALMKNNPIPQGKLEILPLNALDENQFNKVVSHFPKGEIVIVNEGLMMYLDEEEKTKLCGIIHNILKARGGYWITADIYIKNQHEKLILNIDNSTKKFFKEHKIEDNKFASFEEAEIFFNKMGFQLDKEAEVNRSDLSSMKYFLKNISAEQLSKFRDTGRIQATWRLRVAE